MRRPWASTCCAIAATGSVVIAAASCSSDSNVASAPTPPVEAVATGDSPATTTAEQPATSDARDAIEAQPASTDDRSDHTDQSDDSVEGIDSDPDANGPPGDPAQTVTRNDVDQALEVIPAEIEDLLEQSGVPGAAVTIVFEDDVVFAEGFGVREVGENDAVGPDTVFQVASLSKPISATAIAGLVGDGVVAWDEPIIDHLPDFALADPYVTENVTIADMFTHRSGLPEHAGDLLEDLGFDRREIFDRLVDEPLTPFRTEHHYTNIGLTAGAEAAAVAAGGSWEGVIEDRLFEPAGMANTSASFSDYIDAADRAVPHMLDDDGGFTVGEQRNADEQSPAGGVSSTAVDLGTWMRIQLGEGNLGDEPIVDPVPLLDMQTPLSLSNPPRSPSAHSAFYGLGLGVSVDDDGFVRWSHSGAFLLGTGTNVLFVPGQQLGVSVLTNGAPVGMAEAAAQSIVDLIIDGEVTRDWYAGYSGVFAGFFEPETPTDWNEAPTDPAPPSPLGVYVGTYDNDYYGPLQVTQSGDSLTMSLGPDLTFELEPYDGDAFLFTPPGENSLGPTGIVFDVDGDQALSVTSEFYDINGLGTWERAAEGS